MRVKELSDLLHRHTAALLHSVQMECQGYEGHTFPPQGSGGLTDGPLELIQMQSNTEPLHPE